MNRTKHPLIVADVGNSSIDFARYATPLSGVPRPLKVHKLDVSHQQSFLAAEIQALQAWLPPDCEWHVGSVNHLALQRLTEWLEATRPRDTVRQIDFQSLQQPTLVDFPDKVGIDRLAAAKAASHLKDAGRPAVIIDAGTAIKIDALSVAGEFLGGTISPGLRLSLNSLAKGTSKLPSVTDIETPPGVIGKNTEAAISSGVYWTTVGGITMTARMLQEELCQGEEQECDIFVTGGSIPSLLPSLPKSLLYEPSLVLSGLAMAHPTWTAR